MCAAGYSALAIASRCRRFFLAFYPVNPGTLSAVAPQTVQYVWEEDFAYADQTDPGNVTAPVVPVDLALGAGNTSTSGCEPEDFAGFPAAPSR